MQEVMWVRETIHGVGIVHRWGLFAGRVLMDFEDHGTTVREILELYEERGTFILSDGTELPQVEGLLLLGGSERRSGIIFPAHLKFALGSKNPCTLYMDGRLAPLRYMLIYALAHWQIEGKPLADDGMRIVCADPVALLVTGGRYRVERNMGRVCRS